MIFPSGIDVPLPDALTCNGTSGAQQLWPAEQPRALDKLTDEQLFRLAEDLETLITSELEADGDEPSSLTDYIALLSAQVQGEMLRRFF